MAYQGITTGTSPNDGTGDSLLDGAIKINSNFEELYTALGDGTLIPFTVTITGSNLTFSVVGVGSTSFFLSQHLTPPPDRAMILG